MRRLFPPMCMFALTAMEKLHAVPPSFWIKVGLVVLAIITIVIVLRGVAGTNKVVLGMVAFMVFTIVGVNWIYERNEPKFMTTVIDKVAPFFPSKGAYANKQGLKPKTGPGS